MFPGYAFFTWRQIFMLTTFIAITLLCCEVRGQEPSQEQFGAAIRSGNLTLAISILNDIKKKNPPLNPNTQFELNRSLIELYIQNGQESVADSMLREGRRAEAAFMESDTQFKSSHSRYLYYSCELGRLSALQEDYEEAGQIFREAENHARKIFGEAHPEYGATLSKISDYHLALLDHQSAITYALKARQAYQESFGATHDEYVLLTNHLARIEKSRANFASSLSYYLEADSIIRITKGKESEAYIMNTGGLSILYSDMGMPVEAEQKLTEQLSLIRKMFGRKSEQYATVLSSLAIFYRENGLYKKAYTSLEETIEILRLIGKTHEPVYANCLSTLGNLYRTLDFLDQADSVYKEARLIYENLNPHERNQLDVKAEYAGLVGHIAQVCLKRSDYAGAEENMLRAIELHKAVFSDSHPTYLITIQNAGFLFAKIRKPELAEKYFLEALFHYERSSGLSTNTDYVTLLDNLSVFYEENHQPEKAEVLLLRANDAARNVLRTGFSFKSERERAGFSTQFHNVFSALNTFAMRRKEVNPSITGHIYDNALMTKSLLLSSTIQLRERLSGLTGNGEVVSTFNAWIKARELFGKQELLLTAERAVPMETVDDKIDSLEKVLVRSVPNADSLDSKFRMTWRNVLNSLHKNEAAIEFIEDKVLTSWTTDTTNYYALVLTPGMKTPAMVHLCTRGQLALVTNNFSNAMSDVRNLYGKRSLNNGNPTFTGDKLYDLVWKPLEPFLRASRKIYLSPSGSLSKLSFAALPYGHDSLLIDKYEFNYVNTTGSLGSQGKPVDWLNKKAVVTLYGDIDYDARLAMKFEEDRKKGKITPLVYGRAEIDSISKTLLRNGIPVKTYSGKDASEETFKSNLRGNASDIIHLATHGYYYPDTVFEDDRSRELIFLLTGNRHKYSPNPLHRTGLFMAGANNNFWGNYSFRSTLPDQINEGILTADEIANTPLSKTKLVVLSACETGTGDTQSDEGVYGLQRAFRMAGADKVIISLWSANDYVASQLMIEFYRNLVQSKSIRPAFHAAVAKMKAKFQPYLWANFVLVE